MDDSFLDISSLPEDVLDEFPVLRDLCDRKPMSTSSTESTLYDMWSTDDDLNDKSTLRYKTISFPEEEIDTLKSQSNIVTTRVSRDFNRLHLHDVVKTPWNALYVIVKRTVIHDIKDHPYYSELTAAQIKFLETYDEIAVLELKNMSQKIRSKNMAKQQSYLKKLLIQIGRQNK